MEANGFRQIFWKRKERGKRSGKKIGFFSGGEAAEWKTGTVRQQLREEKRCGKRVGKIREIFEKNLRVKCGTMSIILSVRDTEKKERWKKMRVKVRYSVHEVYRPDRRYEQTKERFEAKSMEVEIKEMIKEKFPVAFVVHEMKHVNETAKHQSDFNGKEEIKIFRDEIRTFGGRLFRPIRVSSFSAVSLVYAPLNCISKRLSHVQYFREDYDFFCDESVVVESDDEEQQEKIRRKAESFVIFKGVAWEECGEPVYRIFTSISAEEGVAIELKIVYVPQEEEFDPYILPELPNIFNALEKDKADARAGKLADEWAEKGMETRVINEERIDVILPEMVRLEPEKEEERLRRIEGRRRVEELLEQMRKFEKDEEGNKETKEIRERVRAAVEEIEGLMAKLGEV